MHDSCFLHPQSPLLQDLGWQCSPRDALWCLCRHQHHSPIHFYQPVFYATHNQSYPSASEERAARRDGFGEHVSDALTHKLLDDDTKKILYRSAVRPSDSAHPNKRLVPDGGESSQTPKLNPWQNTTLMILLAGPSYSQRMNKEKGLGPP